MLEIVFIFTVALTPSVLSLWKLRQAETQVQARLLSARDSTSLPRSQALREFSEIYNPVLIGGPVGDESCRFNARSALIRCAVNPDGPCEGCRDYQARE